MKLTSGIAPPLAIVALLFAGTACSGKTNSPSTNAAAASTVRTPLMSDPPSLDPDTFYQRGPADHDVGLPGPTAVRAELDDDRAAAGHQVGRLTGRADLHLHAARRRQVRRRHAIRLSGRQGQLPAADRHGRRSGLHAGRRQGHADSRPTHLRGHSHQTCCTLSGLPRLALRSADDQPDRGRPTCQRQRPCVGVAGITHRGHRPPTS